MFSKLPICIEQVRQLSFTCQNYSLLAKLACDHFNGFGENTNFSKIYVLVWFQPMAPLRKVVTPYLGKLWYLKKRLGLTKQSYFKTHKVRGKTMSFTKVVRDDTRLSLFVKSFWDSALLRNYLGLS